MLIAAKPLAAVPNGPSKVHKARLQALQRHPGTRSDGNVAKAPCKIAVEVIQQMLAHLRPYRFSAMYEMSHSTKSKVAIGYHFHDVEERSESIVEQGSVLRTAGLLL